MPTGLRPGSTHAGAGTPGAGLTDAGGPNGAAGAFGGDTAAPDAGAAGVTPERAGRALPGRAAAGAGGTVGTAAPGELTNVERAAGDRAADLATAGAETMPNHVAGAAAAPGAEAGGFASVLAQAQPAEATLGGATASPEAGVLHASVPTPVDDPGFGRAVMLKVSDLAGRGVPGEHQVTLDLNPVEMGPIRIKLSLQDDQARVDFSAAQTHTRELIESALPALATAMQADGLTLADARVFALADPTSTAAAEARSDTASTAGGDAAGGHHGQGADAQHAHGDPTHRAALVGAAALGVEKAQRMVGNWGEAGGANARRTLGGGAAGLDLYA
ncbi:MAG: hypothetical protein RIQ60_438 [Pseudomonadota bacterium]